MNQDIERVAKAMFDALIADDGHYSFVQGDDPGSVTLDGEFDLRDLARAAIEAMKTAPQPTDTAS